jgi:hypothetical protein
MLFTCGNSSFIVEVIYVFAYILLVDTAVSILCSDAFVNLQWGWEYNIGGGSVEVVVEEEEEEAQLQHKESS